MKSLASKKKKRLPVAIAFGIWRGTLKALTIKPDEVIKVLHRESKSDPTPDSHPPTATLLN